MRDPTRRRLRAVAAASLLGVLLVGPFGSSWLSARQANPKLRLVPWFTKLRFKKPVFLTTAGDGTGRLYVVEQAGVIRRFRNERKTRKSSVFLDISAKVSRRDNEEGLLGLAFHPKFKENGRFYVYYSKKGSAGSIVSLFRVRKNGDVDTNSEEVILRVAQPWRNHNGGMIAFGPDGMLYVGLGDGGGAGDLQSNGLNRGTLLGSILRIDVDTRQGRLLYGIPKDNPFVGSEGFRGEIWAYGLRNPWRFSFDRKTGELWTGDVGQGQWEEVDVIVRGGNYGWNAYEGFSQFNRRNVRRAQNPIEPLAAYGRGEGISITGGYVYRGKRHKTLVGSYLYGDFATGSLWALRRDPGAKGDRTSRSTRTADGVTVTKLLSKTYIPIASFGEDAEGEVYVCAFDGKIYGLERTDWR